MEMKEIKAKNTNNRYKNPWFWIGIVSTVLTAIGVSANTLTSWAAVGDAFLNLISNPFLLGTAALAVIGVFVDPTTKGLKD